MNVGSTTLLYTHAHAIFRAADSDTVTGAVLLQRSTAGCSRTGTEGQVSGRGSDGESPQSESARHPALRSGYRQSAPLRSPAAGGSLVSRGASGGGTRACGV